MIGTTLGPYRLLAELGSGGMGKVFRATVEGRVRGLDTGATVALKVIHPHLLETPGFFKRFLREGEIGKSVVHENVVRTIECDSITAAGARSDFLVMEYVEGQTLRSLLAELDRVPEELCRHIGRETAKGLAAIHAAGVVHRDMKPENVLITRNHVVKVMDLGVARLNDEALRLSQTGAFVGSIHYAAPECFSEGGRHVDGRADLHALGLVLYELACGSNPYFAESIPEILKKILHEEPRRLGDINPQISPFFEDVVHRLLSKNPADRVADATALVGILTEGEDSAGWKSRAKSIQATTRRPLRRIRIPRETAVYGREKEIAAVRALFEEAKAGDGRVVLIEGEAGIGKSRLVDELVSRLLRDGEDLNFLFGSYPPGGAATASGAFSSAFHEHFGASGSAPFLQQTPTLVPAFDALLTGDAPPPSAQPLTKDSLGACFVHATRSLAAERTTVVLIDDLHFAPDEARALFTTLAMAVPGHRVLLIGSTRPGVSEEWRAGLTRLPQTTLTTVNRLGPKDLIELLRDSFKSDALASSLAARIAMKSDGNPFFAFEIIRGLSEGQFITQKGDGTWGSTGVIEEIRIPSSVLDLVSARVGGLSEDERALLDVAACWGYEFDPGLVGEVLRLGRIPALRNFGQIERLHRLVRSAGRNYVFDHHQVQEALYGSINEQLREEYHAALADALAARTKAAERDPTSLDGGLCVDLCEHWLKGARGAAALPYLAAAQTHLMKGHLGAQALALDERALAVPGLLTGAARVKALVRAAHCLDAAGRGVRQRAAADEAVRLADAHGDTALRASAHRLLGHCLERAFENDAAITELEMAIALAREAGDRTVEGNGINCLSLVFVNAGRMDEAQERLQRLIELWQAVGDRRSESVAVGNLANCLQSRGHLAEARAQLERQLALARETGSRHGESVALVNLGVLWLTLGETSRAREAFAGSLVACREVGVRAPEGSALDGLSAVAEEEGDTSGALAWTEEALALRRLIGHRAGVADSLIMLGGLRRRAGDATGARAALDEAASLARAWGQTAHVALALAHLACLQGGDAKAAEAALAEAGESGDESGLRLLLWMATGDRTHLIAAKRLLDAALAKVPAECHTAMLANVRVNREIVAACRSEGL